MANPPTPEQGARCETASDGAREPAASDVLPCACGRYRAYRVQWGMLPIMHSPEECSFGPAVPPPGVMNPDDRGPAPLPAQETPRDTSEDVARLINGLVEAGDLLMLHVQRIDWNPAAANMARECWLESRAALSGDHGQKRCPRVSPASPSSAPTESAVRCGGCGRVAEPTVDGSSDGLAHVTYCKTCNVAWTLDSPRAVWGTP